MLVKIIYELDIDSDDFDPEFVDISAMVKDLAKREMEFMLKNHELEADDFEYVTDQDGEDE